MSSKGFLVKQKEPIVGFCLFVLAFKKQGIVMLTLTVSSKQRWNRNPEQTCLWSEKASPWEEEHGAKRDEEPGHRPSKMQLPRIDQFQKKSVG